MAKAFSKAFYGSKQWEECREGYLRAKGYVCERCGGVATIVHHKTYLTPGNIENPEMTTSWKNLEALCQDCHNKEHFKKKVEQRYKVDEWGRVIIR